MEYQSKKSLCLLIEFCLKPILLLYLPEGKLFL